MSTRKNRWTAEEYENLADFSGNYRDRWWNMDFLELVAKRLNFQEVQDVLDVGCGHGHWGQLLARVVPNNARISGVDWEPAFLISAEQRACKLNFPQHFDYREGSALSLPYSDETFDLVTCQTLLMHIGDVSRALSEMFRVLRPGGVVVASEPSNMAATMTMLMGNPQRTWQQIVKHLQLQFFCERGKTHLNEGSNSIGELLPGYFTRAGLTQVVAYGNDRCNTLTPPYDDTIQQESIEKTIQWAKQDLWTTGGSRIDSERLYLAGGGNKNDFKELWDEVIGDSHDFKNQIENQQLDHAGGLSGYLVCGRKN